MLDTQKLGVLQKRVPTSKSDNDIRSSRRSSFSFSKGMAGAKACMVCPPTTSTRRARTGKRAVRAEEEEQRAQHRASSRLRKRVSRDRSSGMCMDGAECMPVELALISNCERRAGPNKIHEKLVRSGS